MVAQAGGRGPPCPLALVDVPGGLWVTRLFAPTVHASVADGLPVPGPSTRGLSTHSPSGRALENRECRPGVPSRSWPALNNPSPEDRGSILTLPGPAIGEQLVWAKVVDQGNLFLKPAEGQTDPAPVLSTQEAGLRQLKPLGSRGFPGR